jgi:hypothetical protein
VRLTSTSSMWTNGGLNPWVAPVLPVPAPCAKLTRSTNRVSSNHTHGFGPVRPHRITSVGDLSNLERIERGAHHTVAVMMR